MAELGFLALIRSDLERYLETFRLRGQSASFLRIAVESFLFKPGFQAVFLYRVAHSLHRMGLVLLPWAVTRLAQFLTGAEIEFNMKAGPGLFIAHPAGLVVGRGTVMGAHATLFQGVTFGASGWGPKAIGRFPRLGDNVFVFAGATVIGGISVGSDVVVGAQALVRQDVPDGALVVAVSRMMPDKGTQIISKWGLPLYHPSSKKAE
jgi:serine O-acetyltransferase